MDVTFSKGVDFIMPILGLLRITSLHFMMWVTFLEYTWIFLLQLRFH